jgi:hypothetical protein
MKRREQRRRVDSVLACSGFKESATPAGSEGSSSRQQIPFSGDRVGCNG